MLLSNSSLRKYFDYIISAEEVGKYKPSPEPYLHVSKKLNLQISQIALVSSNLWDIAGGQADGVKLYNKVLDKVNKILAYGLSS